MRKRWLLFSILSFVFMGITIAQPGGMEEKREKIESMKVGFITQKLNLTTEEAQKFWPVYNRYNDELEKSRKQFRGKVLEERKNIDNMTEKEAEKALEDMLAYRTSEVELTRKYTEEFKKVLPAQKVVKLFIAEQEFKRELLKQLKEQHKNR
jgi:Spy/CpxP family protein refolding chaperone